MHRFPPRAPASPTSPTVCSIRAGWRSDPWRDLYVAEAGTTEGVLVPLPPESVEPPTRTRCEVYWPVGPKTAGHTGRIVRITAPGVVQVIASGLPSVTTDLLFGGDRSAAAAV